MATLNLLKLLLLLMLMMRNVSVHIWKVKFGHKVKFLFVQTLRTRFQGLVKILKLMFRQDFEAEIWSSFCC